MGMPSATTLYILWALTAFPLQLYIRGKQYRVHQSGNKQYSGCRTLRDCNLWLAVLLEDQDDGNFGWGKPGNTAGRTTNQAVRFHLAMVCIRGRRQRDHSRVLLEKPGRAAVPLRVAKSRWMLYPRRQLRSALLTFTGDYSHKPGPRVESRCYANNPWFPVSRPSVLRGVKFPDVDPRGTKLNIDSERIVQWTTRANICGGVSCGEDPS